MVTGIQSDRESEVDAPAEDKPEVSVCEGCPGRAVFIESGNSDGWIAIDETVEVTR